jgi:hypothetical protein
MLYGSCWNSHSSRFLPPSGKQIRVHHVKVPQTSALLKRKPQDLPRKETELPISNTGFPWSLLPFPWKPLHEWTGKQNSVGYILSTSHINTDFYVRCDQASIISTRLFKSFQTASVCLCVHAHKLICGKKWHFLQRKSYDSSEQNGCISEKKKRDNTLTYLVLGTC